jgi:hypothetical protein
MFLTSQIYNFHFSGQAQTWFTVEAETYAEAVFKAQALRTDSLSEVEGLEVIGHNFDFVRIAGVWQEDEEGKVVGEINYETDLIDRSVVRSFLISALEVCLKWLKTSNRRSYYRLKNRKHRLKNQEEFNRQKEI